MGVIARNRWGTLPTCTPSSSTTCQYTFSGNKITNAGITYDLAGNVTNDGINTYTYDAENRIITVNGSSQVFFYDALGRRTQTIYGGNTYSNIFGLNGRVEVQFTGTSWSRSDLYVGSVGARLGSYWNNTTYFSHADQVGTELMHTGPTGSVLGYCSGILPFGDGGTCTGTSGTDSYYTGQTLDALTGLTQFQFRYLSTTQGRWMHPDPAGLAAADITNPQTWNRYAYVLNNPLSNIDPLGLDCVRDNGDGTTTTFTDDQDNCEGDNGFYFDGTATNAGVDANGNVWASVNGGPEQCSGDCPVSSVTVNGGSPSMVDTITSTLTGVGNQVLNTAQNAGAAALNWLLTPRNPGCMAGATAAGAGTGALVGGGIGSLGFAGGPAGLATTPAGVATGSFVGGGVGFAGGMIYCAKGVGPGFGGNQRQNKAANDAKRQAERETGMKMDDDQQEKFHRLVSHQGYDYSEMVNLAKAILYGQVY